MVISPHFVLPHIGKTGGDAIKQIIESLGIVDISISKTTEKNKHRKVFPDKHQDLVLSFRRLPGRVLSLYYHHKLGTTTFPNMDLLKKDAAEFILKYDVSEVDLVRYLRNGELRPKYCVRSENLRSDLEKMLSHYYSLTDEQKALIVSQETKEMNQYDHGIFSHFTQDQLAQLYAKSPVWSEIETQFYGSLLIE